MSQDEYELHERVSRAKEICGFYTHYKDPEHLYLVVAEGLDERGNKVIIYREHLDATRYFTHPTEEFFAKVTVGHSAEEVPRFRRVM